MIQAVYFSTSPHLPEYRGQGDHGGGHQYTQLQHKSNDLKQKQVVEAVNVAALDVNNVDVPDTTPTAMVDYSDRDCLLPGIPSTKACTALSEAFNTGKHLLCTSW